MVRRRAVLGAVWVAIGVAALAMRAQAGASSPRAPEIGLRDLDGRLVRLADLGDKVVIVDFWASWCEPCVDELRVVERLHRRYRGRGLVVIGVSVDTDVAAAREFLRQHPVTFPVVVDVEHVVADRYGPNMLPSTFVVVDGAIRSHYSGHRESDWRAREREILSLLR